MRARVCARACFDPQVIDCLRGDILYNVTQVRRLGRGFFLFFFFFAYLSIYFFLKGGRRLISLPLFVLAACPCANDKRRDDGGRWGAKEQRQLRRLVSATQTDAR